jgi:DNA polymerase III alpha subunit
MRIFTEYSTNYAYGKLNDVFKHLLALDYKVMPISDRYSTFGWIDWNSFCIKHKVRPIFGVTLGISDNAGDKRPSVSYFTFFAMASIKTVNDLVAFATARTGGYLTYDDLPALDGVVCIADNRAKLDKCDPARVYISLSSSTPIGYYRKAKELGFKFIQSSDNVYIDADAREEYRVMMGRNAYSATYNQHIETYTDWYTGVMKFADLRTVQEALANRLKAESLCVAVLNQPTLPKIDAPQNLWDMCMAGMVRLGVPLEEPYKSRLIHELQVIADKHFEDYFYIVSELMLWARERMIVSPGRGSSAGSLVCYLLGITSVDPIKYNLLFERFLEPSRKDLPDIDMDFDDNLRPMVFAHLEQLYGKEHFGKICAVTRFRPKTIINTAGTQLRIPLWLCQKAAEELDAHGSVDFRALHTFEETFKFGEYSQKLLHEYPEISLVFKSEFHAKNFSTHAAGAVITDADISNYVAVDSRNDTIMADKNTAERLGLLKLDILSVSQLSVFARTLELMGMPATNQFLEETIPFNDEEAFDIINQHKYSGIFQMGNALIKLFKQFYVKSLEDIVAVTSLARPGPLMAGGAQRWVNRRNALQDVTYAHPCLEPFLKSTFGELVYQEQLMQIASAIGCMSVDDVTSLRKAVAKSKGAEALRPFGDKFKAGAATHGFVGEALDKFWDDLCGFGAYSFNRSHAVSYSMITYYCCWFKAFFPVEFAAASLDAETDPEKQIKLLRELHTEGIGYVPIDPELSVDRWTVRGEGKDRVLVGPLTSIKGIGPAKLAMIIEARQSGKELPPGLAKQLKDAITPIDSLTPVTTAVARCIPDLKAVNIVSKPTPIAQLDAGDNGSFLIIGLLVGLKKKDRNDAESLARRKGKRVTGNSLALNLTFRDDSGADIVAIIDPSDYADASPALIERGGVDKAIYAVKGTIPDNFRMLSIKGIRFLCNIDDGLRSTENDWFSPQVPKEDYFAEPKKETEDAPEETPAV